MLTTVNINVPAKRPAGVCKNAVNSSFTLPETICSFTLSETTCSIGGYRVRM